MPLLPCVIDDSVSMLCAGDSEKRPLGVIASEPAPDNIDDARDDGDRAVLSDAATMKKVCYEYLCPIIQYRTQKCCAAQLTERDVVLEASGLKVRIGAVAR